jgi:glycosyltransferase involved in cell wall biosynthesis
MKILLANYRYFVSGGPGRYMFNVTDALAARGHEVIPFSVKYARNKPTPYASYFVEPIGREDEVTFGEQRVALRAMWRTWVRLFYAPDVEHAVSHLIVDTRPQVAYVWHYLRKLSPSLLVGLKKARLPIVVRLSDFAMLCPRSHCLRNEIPCELCVRGDLRPSVRFRCVQHSTAVSLLNALATWYHRFRRFFDLIDVFVTTNKFMYDMMASAGFSKTRLRYIPTFVDGELFRPCATSAKDRYIVYAGRLEALKGLHVMVNALGLLSRLRPDLRPRLKIVGSGNAAYIALLKQRVQQEGLQAFVDFIGEVKATELSGLLERAQLSVVPSLWFENLPNSILESYACGTPVLASDIGSLPECVWNGETGYLFRTGDAHSLAERIAFCMDNPAQVSGMSRRARQVAETDYAPKRHIAALEDLFAELTNPERPTKTGQSLKVLES